MSAIVCASGANMGISSSIHRARRCPERVVTSTPVTISTGLLRGGEIAQHERATDVVVVGERDDVETSALGGVEDRLGGRGRRRGRSAAGDRRGPGGHRADHTRSNTVHCSR
jgi:hypothetical protein